VKKNRILLLAGLVLSGMQSHAMHRSSHNQKNDSNLDQNITHSVSYIYYPSDNNICLSSGHAALECNGQSHMLGVDSKGSIIHREKTLTDVITKAQNNGQPFFRFVFKANEQQADTTFASISQANPGRTCSDKALYPLKKANICSVPFPINISPLMSATYLTGSKMLGCNNVETIEYYGNPSLTKSTLKMLKGPFTELATIGAAVGVAALNAWFISSIISD